MSVTHIPVPERLVSLANQLNVHRNINNDSDISNSGEQQATNHAGARRHVAVSASDNGAQIFEASRVVYLSSIHACVEPTTSVHPDGKIFLTDPKLRNRAGASESTRQLNATHALPSDTTEPYRNLINLLVSDVLSSHVAGFNTTLVAFGESGIGKTTVLFGRTVTQSNGSFMSVYIDRLFRHLTNKEGDITDTHVLVSAWHVDGDKLLDLLPIKRSGEAGSGEVTSELNDPSTATVVECGSASVSKEIIAHARAAIAAATQKGSHTHVFFRISLINFKQDTCATIHVVDLVGNQPLASNIVVSNPMPVSPTSRQSRRTINRQLLSFNRLIGELSQIEKHGEAATVLSARQSLLTRVLAPLLINNARPVLVSFVSPHPDHYLNTLNTLKILTRAKGIKIACVRAVPQRYHALSNLTSAATILSIDQMSSLKPKVNSYGGTLDSEPSYRGGGLNFSQTSHTAADLGTHYTNGDSWEFQEEQSNLKVQSNEENCVLDDQEQHELEVANDNIDGAEDDTLHPREQLGLRISAMRGQIQSLLNSATTSAHPLTISGTTVESTHNEVKAGDISDPAATHVESVVVSDDVGHTFANADRSALHRDVLHQLEIYSRDIDGGASIPLHDMDQLHHRRSHNNMTVDTVATLGDDTHTYSRSYTHDMTTKRAADAVEQRQQGKVPGEEEEEAEREDDEEEEEDLTQLFAEISILQHHSPPEDAVENEPRDLDQGSIHVDRSSKGSIDMQQQQGQQRPGQQQQQQREQQQRQQQQQQDEHTQRQHPRQQQQRINSRPHPQHRPQQHDTAVQLNLLRDAANERKKAMGRMGLGINENENENHEIFRGNFNESPEVNTSSTHDYECITTRMLSDSARRRQESASTSRGVSRDRLTTTDLGGAGQENDSESGNTSRSTTYASLLKALEEEQAQVDSLQSRCHELAKLIPELERDKETVVRVAQTQVENLQCQLNDILENGYFESDGMQSILQSLRDEKAGALVAIKQSENRAERIQRTYARLEVAVSTAASSKDRCAGEEQERQQQIAIELLDAHNKQLRKTIGDTELKLEDARRRSRPRVSQERFLEQNEAKLLALQDAEAEIDAEISDYNQIYHDMGEATIAQEHNVARLLISETNLLEDRTALSYDILAMRRFVSDHATGQQVADALLAARSQRRRGGDHRMASDARILGNSGLGQPRPRLDAKTSQHPHIQVLLRKLDASFRKPLVGSIADNNNNEYSDMSAVAGTTALPPRAPRLVKELKSVFLGLEQQVAEANARERQASRTLQALIAEAGNSVDIDDAGLDWSYQ